MNFIRSMAKFHISKKNYNFRLADEEVEFLSILFLHPRIPILILLLINLLFDHTDDISLLYYL